MASPGKSIPGRGDSQNTGPEVQGSWHDRNRKDRWLVCRECEAEKMYQKRMEGR